MKICSSCKKEKSKSEFHKDKKSKDGLFSWCKICSNEYSKNYRRKYPKKCKESDKRSRQKHKEERRKYQERYRQEHREELARDTQQYRQERKIQVFSYYSNGKIKCGLCNEERLACLSIDHINGGGVKHRKKIKRGSGSSFYNWLIKNSYPSGYRILCMNCQFIERKRIAEAP